MKRPVRRTFGASGVKVPVIGQGTWHMGDAPQREAEALLRGLELGLTHLDTAELYGPAEDVVGQALATWRSRGGAREDVFLVSKVLPENATYSGTIEACERSLAKLGVESLDCYLLHWRGRIALDETLRALEDLVAQGKTRYLGVSNFDVDDLIEAEDAIGPGKIVCDQVYYDLAHRGVERRLLPHCQSREIALVGYSPFGSKAPAGKRSRGGKVLAEVAERRQATIAQVTLAFLTRLEGTFTIPKASRIPHVEENAGARGLQLTDEDVAAIEAAYPLPEEDTGLAYL